MRIYISTYFKIDSLVEMHEVIMTNGFATLTSLHQGSLTATHLPLLLSEDKTELIGHFATANSQWVDLEGQEILVIFQGPHCYISPSWYETQETVPTWNYVTVHVKGRVQLLKGEDPRLWQSMVALTEKYEDPASDYSLMKWIPLILQHGLRGLLALLFLLIRLKGRRS